MRLSVFFPIHRLRSIFRCKAQQNKEADQKMHTPIKVLIVEDDDATLLLLRCVVEVQEFRVVVATNLKSAREAIREFQPEIAILDLSLPDGDGIDLVYDIRKSCPQAAITLLSDKANARPGAYNWIGIPVAFCKPLDPQAIGSWLNRHRDYINNRLEPSIGKNVAVRTFSAELRRQTG
jgi:DNA-binding NtrC family response regulator